MTDRKIAVKSINSMFSMIGYPDDFLNTYDQLECLASHHGRETFLVAEKETHKLRIAKCYDAALFTDLNEENILNRLQIRYLFFWGASQVSFDG